jgi:hypothetical protein
VPDLDFLVHLPLLQIDQELLPFGAARLYRAPFEKYDEITLGAFSKQRARYEATEPVFLSFSVPIPEEGLERRVEEVKGMMEIKIPRTRGALLAQLGLEVINLVHDRIVNPAWNALLLAAPALALAPPRWSQTFMSIDGGFTLDVGGRPAVGVRVQGEADHEYFFQADAPSERIPASVIARASELFGATLEWEQIPDLRVALTALRVGGFPTLSRQDRLTIAVQALESLLLPEVRTGLKRTFARRLASLLASDAESADRITSLARDLYRLRSESVHGNELVMGGAAIQGAFAEQLLSGAIQAMGKLLKSGQTAEEIRARLDKGDPAVEVSTFQVEARPAGRASEYRLAPRQSSPTLILHSAIAAPDGHVCSWSPLLGLASETLERSQGMALGEPAVCQIFPFTPDELLELEDRDIRQDFLGSFVAQGHPMCVLLTLSPHDEASISEAAPALDRMRHFGVLTLRLAGYDQFHDPDLFGSTVFEGSQRFRRPTIVRQTVMEEMRHEATQRLGPADQPRLAAIWAQLWRYDQNGRILSIEHVLSLFRRTFDRDFLEPEHRALFLVSLLDAMLGPFRDEGDPVQLGALVQALIGRNSDVTWFIENGRQYRNRVAHGEFTSDDAGEPIEHMSRIISRLVLELIKTWNGVERRDQTYPSKALIERATNSRVNAQSQP